MTPDLDAEWWNTTDVAAYLGVRVATVSTYRKRSQMPPPDQSLGRTHLWHPATIVQWHRGRHRPGVGGRPTRPTEAEVVDVVARPPTDGASRWAVYGERTLYENRWATLSLVDVEPPEGARYESHVVTLPPAAMTAVLNDGGTHVLLMWRHRFAVDRWGWELPGGVVETGEDPAATAAREVLEETGYRPRRLTHAVTFEPMVGQVRSPHHVYIARGADFVDEHTEPAESDEVRWVPVRSIPALIRDGDVSSSGAIIGLLLAIAGVGSADLQPGP